MNIVVSDPKNGMAYSKKTEKEVFLNYKIGDEISLDELGLEGYKGIIKGGSDKQGFPMHPTLIGIGRKKVLLAKGTGFKPLIHGQRKKISIRANMVSNEISQLNVKITAYGSKPLSEIFEKPEKKAKESKESVKEQMIKQSLESVGKIDATEAMEVAKSIKGKAKG